MRENQVTCKVCTFYYSQGDWISNVKEINFEEVTTEEDTDDDDYKTARRRFTINRECTAEEMESDISDLNLVHMVEKPISPDYNDHGDDGDDNLVGNEVVAGEGKGNGGVRKSVDELQQLNGRPVEDEILVSGHVCFSVISSIEKNLIDLFFFSVLKSTWIRQRARGKAKPTLRRIL